MSSKTTNYAVAFAAGALGIAGVVIARPSPLSAAPVASITAALKTAAMSILTITLMPIPGPIPSSIMASAGAAGS